MSRSALAVPYCQPVFLAFIVQYMQTKNSVAGFNCTTKPADSHTLAHPQLVRFMSLGLSVIQSSIRGDSSSITC